MTRLPYIASFLTAALLIAACGGPSGSIVVTPDELVLLPGSSVVLVASVHGLASSDLIWEATAGTVVAHGSEASYRAPSLLGQHTISVWSAVDAGVRAQVLVNVEGPADFAPSVGSSVIEGDVGDVARLPADSRGVVRFASRVFNAEFHVEFVDEEGASLPGAVVLYVEQVDGSGQLLAFDPTGELGPLLIRGGRDHFSRVLGGDTPEPENSEIGASSVTFLVVAGVLAFGSILWTAEKTGQSGQEIETFFETDAVDCDYEECYCKTPQEISVLHAARAQQQFAIPRVVSTALLVGLIFDVPQAVGDGIEAIGLALDVTDLWDNFGFGPVKLNPFSWAEDWVAEAKDRELLTGITIDSHVLYAVDTVQDASTGRAYELVFIINEDCNPMQATPSSPPVLAMSGRFEADGRVAMTARLPFAVSNVPVYFAFRNDSAGSVTARHALTDSRGFATISGPLWSFGSGFGVGTNSVVSAAAPTLDLVDEATFGALVGGVQPPSATIGGIWTFAGSGVNEIRGGGDWSLRNVAFSSGSLVLDGVYEGSDRADAETAIASVTNMSIDRFTLAVRFLPAFPNNHNYQPVITAGRCYRWLSVYFLDGSGETFLVLNNGDEAYPIAPMRRNDWNELHLSYDHAERTFTVNLNGSPTQTIDVGSGFDWNVRSDGGGRDLSFQNYGNGAAFRGRIDWLVWTNEITTIATVRGLVAGK